MGQCLVIATPCRGAQEEVGDDGANRVEIEGGARLKIPVPSRRVEEGASRPCTPRAEESSAAADGIEPEM
jgi:hypothetical protein